MGVDLHLTLLKLAFEEATPFAAVVSNVLLVLGAYVKYSHVALAYNLVAKLWVSSSPLAVGKLAI